jgi:hypothetical protein
MEAAIDDLLHKVRLIAETPKGDLLRQLVDLLYERLEEEYDTEPLTDEDLEAIRRGREDVENGRVVTLEEFNKKSIAKLNNLEEQLTQSLKFDPNKENSQSIPKKYGVYVFFNKNDDSIEYIGRAIGNYGLYQRIIRQHFNPSYLLTDKSKWHSEKDHFQINNNTIINGKQAIDKSAFRKNISRYNKLRPGVESVNFIKKNYYFRILVLDDKNEAIKLETYLKGKYRPKYNIQ